MATKKNVTFTLNFFYASGMFLTWDEILPKQLIQPTQISFVYLRADKHQTAAKQSGQKNDWMTLGYTDIQIYRLILWCAEYMLGEQTLPEGRHCTVSVVMLSIERNIARSSWELRNKKLINMKTKAAHFVAIHSIIKTFCNMVRLFR